MNKILLVFFASIAVLFLYPGVVQAVPLCQMQNPTGPNIDIDPAVFNPPAGSAPANSVDNFITNGIGLIPCGVSVNQNIRVICPCQLQHIFIMLIKIARFLVWSLAAPVAGLMIALGGILILLSGVNPNWVNTGKNILWYSIIGVGTMLCAWLIVNILLTRVLGIGFNWSVFLF